METIRSYIENVFKMYPNNAEVARVKAELTATMEDKYMELKAQGKSENEAIGIVISEFGNMDELAEELGLSGASVQTENVKPSVLKERHVSMEEAKAYIKAQKSVGRRIALGVAMCILSVLAICIFDALSLKGVVNDGTGNIVGRVIMFSMIAIAVAIFITTGFRNTEYEEWKKDLISLDAATFDYVNAQYQSFRPKMGGAITVGVMLCILSVIPSLISEEVFRSNNKWIGELFSASLFVFVAIGVTLFITAGVTNGAYERLLNKGDYSREKIEKENGIIGIISAIYWPVAVVVYLIWSFATGDWKITWLVWPVAGIMFGAIATVCSIIENRNRK